MRSFLSEVAQHLYSKYGDDISSLSIMFSSKRARLFFTDALSTISEHPIWEPDYISMDDVMRELSGLQTTDRIRLISELYSVYSKYHRESFDKFYFWGEVLLSDFDMIDKYMVDASQLFRNISDLKELEADVGYLTETQLRIITEFWRTVYDTESLSEQKQKFLAVWRTLGAIYKEYRERLISLGMAYTGLQYREAVERIARGEEKELPERRYVVAGFNALSTCEHRLLAYLNDRYDVEFFWDYDDYYVNDFMQEAGLFVRRNLKYLPSKGVTSHDNLRNIASIHTIATGTNVAQCKYAVNILRELAKKQKLDKETAVVLTDENMLMPLLYSIPEDFGAVNVTMGYPLKNTSAYSFLERLLELQHHAHAGDGGRFYYADVDGVLAHPYIADAERDIIGEIRNNIVKRRLIQVPSAEIAKTPRLKQIFRVAENWRDMITYLRDVIALAAEMPYEGDEVKYRIEYLSVLSESLRKLYNIVDECGTEMSLDVCRSLVRRYLQRESIPFEGEPLDGLQVMGILETRNLDFKNVIILSMTDDNFPGSHNADSSFIPYSLRFAYGLPTPEHHDGVNAYYFYRLIQRAENVYMIYCSHADDKSTGEPSRYIRQLEYETDFAIGKTNVRTDVTLTGKTDMEIVKDAAVMDKLNAFADGRSYLSPTAFSRYVKCPMKFYFASVAGVAVNEELHEEVDNMTFGNIFHKAAELFYGNIISEQHPATLMQKLVADGLVERSVDGAINTEYFGHSADEPLPQLNGELTIVRDIVVRYLRDNLIKYDSDSQNDKFTVLHTEYDVEYDFPLTVEGRNIAVKLKGRSDRIDSLDNGQLRVVDYKTGSHNLKMAGLEKLFNGESEQRHSNLINTLMYAMMLYNTEGRDVVPALYYVREMGGENYSPLIEDTALKRKGVLYSEYADEYTGYVAATLEEMYDRNTPFRLCEDEKSCVNCDFKSVCGREK